jgi:hypothetical protein
VIAVPIPLVLGGILAGLWFLADLLAAHLQGLVLLLTRSTRAASVSYDLLVFPGVLVHEGAHIVAAVLLRVRVLRADLFRFRRARDARQGEVVVERADPLRMSLIGAAPLLAGVALLLLLLRLIEVEPGASPAAALNALRRLSRTPLNLFGLYLVWAIANTMFPSAADRAAWWVVGAALAVGGTFLLLSGYRVALPDTWQTSIVLAAERLTAGLLPVLMLDLGLLVLLVCLEWLAMRLTRQRLVRR